MWSILILRVLCSGFLYAAAVLVLSQLGLGGGLVHVLAWVAAVLGIYLSDILLHSLRPESSSAGRSADSSSKSSKGESRRNGRQSREDRNSGPTREGEGTIRWFGRENYGFIVSADNGDEIFFHINDLPSEQQDEILPYIKEGQLVNFQARETNRGWRAQTVDPILSDSMPE